MIIETTIHLDKNRTTKLYNASKIIGRSKTTIITLLINELINHNSDFLGRNRTIQYQEKRPATYWTNIHVTLVVRDYEYLLDMRKLFKRSASFLIAFAIDLYLSDIINRITKISEKFNCTDNYIYKHYIIIKEIVDDAICWKIYWGYPKTTSHIFPRH